MNKDYILKKKKEAYEKWNDVVKKLAELESFVGGECGYCELYKKRDCGGIVICDDCPLYKETCSTDYRHNSLLTQFVNSFYGTAGLACKIKYKLLIDVDAAETLDELHENKKKEAHEHDPDREITYGYLVDKDVTEDTKGEENHGNTE